MRTENVAGKEGKKIQFPRKSEGNRAAAAGAASLSSTPSFLPLCARISTSRDEVLEGEKERQKSLSLFHRQPSKEREEGEVGE